MLYEVITALGDRHDMIERQFFRSEFAPAILAGISVSGKNIDAGKLDGAVAVLQTDELEEPHHGRQLEGNRNTVDLAIINLEDFYLSLPQESDRFLPMNNAQGRITSYNVCYTKLLRKGIPHG